ncbi:MAG TPA: hypothetical protein PLB52_04190 [Candidatus Moranbacteria bacterium]|nr:hypothetical protein [Candidatus Moranbacteria bacterium]
MEYDKIYERVGDYDPYVKLLISEDKIGDISVGIYDPNNKTEPIRIVKFAILPGGGRSMNTLHVLNDLALAIEKDNQENPDVEF